VTDFSEEHYSRSSIQRMTERLLNRTMGKEELEHFEQILLNDPAARLAYIEHIHVHAELSHLGGAAEALGDEVFSERERPSLGMGAVIATVMTCCLILGLAVYVTLTRTGLDQTGKVLGYIVPNTDQFPGLAARPNPNPEVVRIGELLNLPFGMTQFQLSSGVACTLHGPARIRFESPSKVSLESGTFVANVPPEAVGFRVETPHIEVIDLGTAFSLSVGSESEVRVFQGVVAVRSKSDSRRDSAPLLVRAGESIRFSGQLDTDHQIEKSVQPDSDPALAGLQRLYGIKSLEGEIKLLASPPQSLRMGRLVSDSFIHLIPERVNAQLDRPVQVVPSFPRTYTSPGEYIPSELPSGTRYSSFLLHCDPVERKDSLVATVRFDHRIIGLIFSSDGLQETDSILGHPDVQYPLDKTVFEWKQSRGCVIPYGTNEERNDEIRIHEDGKGITVKLFSPESNMDQLRVLTAVD
jgi:Fe2+-dicitrate sensor, membrane component